MTNRKKHNKLYFFTTISIYVGLVLVGGAPEVFAGSKLNQQLNGPSFELSTRSEVVNAKKKYRRQVKDDKLVPHDFAGNVVFQTVSKKVSTLHSVCEETARESQVITDAILTTPMLPRASL